MKDIKRYRKEMRKIKREKMLEEKGREPGVQDQP